MDQFADLLFRAVRGTEAEHRQSDISRFDSVRSFASLWMTTLRVAGRTPVAKLIHYPDCTKLDSSRIIKFDGAKAEAEALRWRIEYEELYFQKTAETPSRTEGGKIRARRSG
jgi:hypothetical protein